MPAPRAWSVGVLAAALAGCAATTRVELTPPAPAPVCDAARHALVLWAPQWRPDQKDVPAREAAAGQGLARFFGPGRCFAAVDLRRLPDAAPATLDAALAAAPPGAARVVIVVRELGPVLTIGAGTLVEGGTEVRLDISAQAPGPAAARQAFSVHWRHGGAGVVKGVASLPDDLAAALAAALQPGP